MSVGSISGVAGSASSDDSATVLVAKKALDVQRQQGQAIVQMMESSKVEVDKGQNINVMV
ncbi:MAG: putative motility protein [Desulfobacteraceae bacterium]|nr:putative motility protein [Desulfobacteraceae bacterium]